MKEPLPNLKLTRTGREQRGVVWYCRAGGVQPSSCITSHSLVQARAALLSEYWPELLPAASNGLFGWIWPPAIIRSGK